MMQIKHRYIFGLLVLILFAVWVAVFSLPDQNLHLVACDVGQGDAILATYGNIQILTDGGANNKVLDCLGRHMPFWDRTIELVILTHPDRDHFRGLIEVFRRYRIDNYLSNGLESGSREYQVLKNEVGGRGTKTIIAREGLSIRAGKIRLDILNPTEEELKGLKTNVSERNEYSVVNTLSLGDFDALLTGDVENGAADNVAGKLALNAKREWEYIKIPHHGSKNGLTQKLLDAVRPKLAVISVGKNSYGHPHEETLKILRKTKILRTDEMGDVEVVSDGKKFWVKN
mgnify:CR=1 FL=1